MEQRLALKLIRWVLETESIDGPAMLVVQHFLDDNGEFWNAGELLQPQTFLSFLLVIKSPASRLFFFSSGLYRAIPMNMADELFSLPYPVILWLVSVSDENHERSAQYRTPEFTRMCIARVKRVSVWRIWPLFVISSSPKNGCDYYWKMGRISMNRSNLQLSRKLSI